MNRIESLLAKVTGDASPRLVGNGYVCWLVFAQPLPASFFQSLADIGGWPLAEEPKQALWFFPDPEVLLGLTRLHNWARLHPVPTSITVFEGSLAVDGKLGQSLKVKSDLQALRLDFSRRLVVRVSPRLREAGRSLAGLSFRHVNNPDSLAGDWYELEGSDQVSVSYGLAWLWVIRPQGSRQDKLFAKGWRSYFERLEALFTQNKISYLHAEDQTVVLRITSVRTMARLTADLLAILEDTAAQPWSCQYMAVEMGDYSFSPDFPFKVRYILEPLEPNAVHLPLSTVFQLADPRIVPVDSRVSMNSSKISDLFQVRFHSSRSGRRRGNLSVFLPASLVRGGGSPCFYCGMRFHVPAKCPTRVLLSGNMQVSDMSRFALLDLETLPGILAEMEKALAPDVTAGLASMVEGKGHPSLVLRAMFEINMLCQLRMMGLVWRAKGKEWPRGIEDQRGQGDEQLLDAVAVLRTTGQERVMEKLENIVLASPKNYQPRVLLGFMALEREEFKRAAGFWEEAQALCYTGLQRSYILLLLGRLREVSGDFPEAIRIYGRALSESPGFLQARYRQAACLIKSGYLNEAQALLRDLIKSDPDCFSAVLLDPELEGGRSHLSQDLWEIWDEAKISAAEVLGAVEHLPDLLARWLPANHPDYRQFHERIEALSAYAGINNYASMARLLRGTMTIKADIQARVKRDIQQLTNRRAAIRERLKEIQREASWFPFPSMMKGFNRLFNLLGEHLSLVGHLDLYVPEKFRQAHEAMSEAERSLATLEKKLLLLQGVRNGILFLLLSGKYLLVFEILALVLAGLVSVAVHYLAPAQVILGRDLGQDRWLVLNISLIFFSFLAILGTALRAASRFEAYKNEVLDKRQG